MFRSNLSQEISILNRDTTKVLFIILMTNYRFADVGVANQTAHALCRFKRIYSSPFKGSVMPVSSVCFTVSELNMRRFQERSQRRLANNSFSWKIPIMAFDTWWKLRLLGGKTQERKGQYVRKQHVCVATGNMTVRSVRKYCGCVMKYINW